MHKLLIFTIGLVFFVACKNETTAPAETEKTAAAEAPATGGTQEQIIDHGDGSFTRVNQDGSVSKVAADGTITTTSTDGSVTTTTTKTAPGFTTPPSTSSTPYSDKPVYGESRKSEEYSTIIPDDPNYGKGASQLPIPDPCTLIPVSFLNSTFGLRSAPEIKNGTMKPRPAEKSCFFKFEDPKKPNGGIMLQIMTNPFPSEIPDYPDMVIKGKIADGEQVPYENKVLKFGPWNELGDGGCYSYEAGKYHWKIKDQYVFLLAFNTYHDEAAQKQLAAKIGREIMKNFSSKIK
ncbi:MAG: hypothetical protein U0V54_01195 [Saprospiraceae bacterium]|nr:hypothetical protein [Saprospiraceae bacterium]